MNTILLFGAGKSATVLIDYLLTHAPAENFQFKIVDANLAMAEEKLAGRPNGSAHSFDITDNSKRSEAIASADIVISLMPPSLHSLIARDCLHHRRHLLTASYIDEEMQSLRSEIEKAGLLFLCEMGLDPGIDHMSAKQLIDRIKSDGGRITSFLSHCGGLVAPESDDNPWHYKISWNPRNVVNAGKAGAIFRQDGAVKELEYDELFAEKRYVVLPGGEPLCWYPNRDSLSYISKYGMEDTGTFIRTTLRHPDFVYGWKNVLELKLTEDIKRYDTDGKTLQEVFKEHMDGQQFGEWVQNKLNEQFDSTKGLLHELANLVKLEEEATQKGIEPVEEFMMVDDNGDLQKIDIDRLKISAAATLADRMHDANLTLKQLFFLGMDDNETQVNIGRCSPADLLQFALEKKLMLQPGDKDWVIMMHELEYTLQGKSYKATSTLSITGENESHTAMAKTVGLPLGMAARRLLNGTLLERGLHLPITPAFYIPFLQELEAAGIVFEENVVELS